MCNHLHGTIQVSKKYRQQSSYSKKGDEEKNPSVTKINAIHMDESQNPPSNLRTNNTLTQSRESRHNVFLYSRLFIFTSLYIKEYYSFLLYLQKYFADD